jgi:hypothetical protein
MTRAARRVATQLVAIAVLGVVATTVLTDGADTIRTLISLLIVFVFLAGVAAATLHLLEEDKKRRAVSRAKRNHGSDA